MKTIGVTGAIGSGKSTVASIMKYVGAIIIDADQIARNAVKPGSHAWEQIAATFGGQLLQDDGSLNRKELGRIVFGDDNALAVLNSIIHPAVISSIFTRIERIQKQHPQVPAIVLDVPLLFEVGLDDVCDCTIIVTTSEKNQYDRLKRQGLSDTEISQRRGAQKGKNRFIPRADFVIANDGTLDDLQKNVQEVWDRIIQ